MASTFSSWIEIAVFSLIFVGVLGIIIGEMNVTYNENNVVPFSDTSNFQSNATQYVTNSQQSITNGEVVYLPYQGMTLKNSFGLVKDGLDMIWRFVSGNWINQVAVALNLGEGMTKIVAPLLQILWILGLIFFVVYIIFKVMP
jgi:hypothetical protein